jgi:hypothetical protein
MKIDKTTGDALSNWICPQCSNGVPAQAVEEKDNSVVGDQKLHAQESFANPPLAHHPHLDISPHAPNPLSLWPPFGLRSSKESSEVLGNLGESDDEDFEGPIQSITRVKSESNSSQFYVPQSAATSSLLSFSQTPSCQPVTSAAITSVPSFSQSPFCQPISSSAGMAASSQNKVGTSQYAQNTLPINSSAVSSSLPSLSFKANHPPTALPQLSLAPAPNFVASSAAHHAARPGSQAMTNPNAMKTNHPPSASPQLSLAPAINVVASSAAHHAVRPVNQAMTNPLNAMGLNSADLSVAVANLDAFVLAGDSGLPSMPTAPPCLQTETAQANVANSAPKQSANGQSYNTAALTQAIPKAP